MTAVKFARTGGIKMFIVITHKSFAARRIIKYPVLESLTKCILCVSCLNGFLGIRNTLFLAVYDFYITDLHIAQIE